MVRFVGKGHLNDQTKFIAQILVPYSLVWFHKVPDIVIRALTMVRFVGKGHLNDQNPFFGQILVRHLVEKLAFSESIVRYHVI